MFDSPDSIVVLVIGNFYGQSLFCVVLDPCEGGVCVCVCVKVDRLTD